MKKINNKELINNNNNNFKNHIRVDKSTAAALGGVVYLVPTYI